MTLKHSTSTAGTEYMLDNAEGSLSTLKSQLESHLKQDFVNVRVECGPRDPNTGIRPAQTFKVSQTDQEVMSDGYVFKGAKYVMDGTPYRKLLHFEEEHKRQTNNINRHIKQTEELITFYKKKIAEWKP